MADTPLKDVPGWSPQQVDRLKDTWITTAEQVVALNATQGGGQSLAEHLAVSEAEVQRLVAAARAVLAPDVRAALEQKTDTSEFGLGALPQ